MLSDFLGYLTNEESASANTVAAYRSDLREFANWFLQSTGQDLDAELVTSVDLKEYQSYLQVVKQRKPSTINRKLKAIKRWLEWSGYQLRFPKAIKEQRHQPRALERREQNAFLRELERSRKLRDIVLVRVMLSCGLRVSEAVRLKVKDINIGERCGVITVRQGKGNKYREVPIPAETRRVLKEYLSGKDQDAWLFQGQNGNHITPRAAQQIVSKYAYRAKVNVHPHILRHTCAMNLLRGGADIRLVAAILGHENINTTAIYTVPGVNDMAKAIEGAEM